MTRTETALRRLQQCGGGQRICVNKSLSTVQPAPMSLKRYRDTPPSPSPSPPAKLSHLPTPRPYTCTLPPTCHVHHTHYHSQYHLERHHDIFHRWVCTASVRAKDEDADDVPQSFVAQRGWKKWRECLKVFPEERLLDLVRLHVVSCLMHVSLIADITQHYTETHDPIARERQKNGEKIVRFALSWLVLTRVFRIHSLNVSCRPISAARYSQTQRIEDCI